MITDNAARLKKLKTMLNDLLNDFQLNTDFTSHVTSSVYQKFFIMFYNKRWINKSSVYVISSFIWYSVYRDFLNIIKLVLEKMFGKSRVQYIVGSLYQD